MANLNYQDAEAAWNRFKSGETAGGSTSTKTLTGSSTYDINSLYDFSSLNPEYSGLPAPNQPNLDLLKSQYYDTRSAYDPTETITAILQSAQNTFSAGKQAANNAARSYANRQAQAGASTAGADVVKSQSLLPYLSSLAASKTEAAKYKDAQKASAFTAATEIAKTISELEQGYYNTLSDFISQQNSLASSRYEAELSALTDAAKAQLSADLTAAELQSKTESDTLARKLDYYNLREKTKTPTYGVSNTLDTRKLVSGNLGLQSKDVYEENPYLYYL